MTDGQGRSIDYLRLSVTDRCNLRCVYCMPPEGVAWTPHGDILSYEEILRLCRLFARLGVRKVRLTGGEPLTRKGLPALVKGLHAIEGVEELAMTTNGVGLARALPALRREGLTALNLSLDTLDRGQYAAITRRDALGDALAGLSAALAEPGLRVKLNCVPMGENDAQLVPLAALARDYPLAVRFIELMPIGLGRTLPRRSEAEVLARLERAFGPALPCSQGGGSGPGHYVTFAGFRGRVGFISALSHPFCTGCNRVRLTASGFLKTCLQYDAGVDLRALLRGGAPDAQLLEAMREAIRQKPPRHHFGSGGCGTSDERRNMNEIGG